jgi:hypothetical protein
VLAVVVVVVVVASGMVVAVGGAEPVAAASSCSSPVGPGQIRVVVVVDPGDGGPSGPTSTCLVVAADGRANMGSNVLAQRAQLLGRASPRYAGSGLLCAIDSYPGQGCPTGSGGAYDYWAYFNGAGGSWSYGSDNPFVRRLGDGEIMGWRYNKGTPDGQAPAPRIAPSSGLFPPVVTPPPAATAPPTGSSGSTPAGSVAPDGSVAPTPGAAGSSTSDGDGSEQGPADPSAADPSAADGAEADVGQGAATDGESDGAADEGAATDAEGTVELAADPASADGSGSDAGRWLGVAIVVAAIGALGTGAAVRSRTRARP